MKARKVYRNDEMPTATITDSNLSVNNSNTISEPPAYFYVWDPIPRRCLRCRMHKDDAPWRESCTKKKDIFKCTKNYKKKKNKK